MNAPRPFTGLGFAVGSVRGVRTFRYIEPGDGRVDEFGRPGQLLGMYYPQVWGEGINEAECRRKDQSFNYYTSASAILYPSLDDDDENGPFPLVPTGGEHMPHCSCGFYAYYDGSNDYYKPDQYGSALIRGVIEGFGEVLIGPRGFRCTKARLVALCVAPWHPAADLILAHYPGVPTFSDFGLMVRAFPEDDGGARAEHEARMKAEREARDRAEAEAAACAMETDGGPVI